jgi:hypothetical protein
VYSGLLGVIKNNDSCLFTAFSVASAGCLLAVIPEDEAIYSEVCGAVCTCAVQSYEAVNE